MDVQEKMEAEKDRYRQGIPVSLPDDLGASDDVAPGRTRDRVTRGLPLHPIT